MNLSITGSSYLINLEALHTIPIPLLIGLALSTKQIPDEL